MPTGGGKSLCYQIPALAKDGMCLVISPLIALMKDQVENIRKKGITAFAIYSGMSRKEIVNTLHVASNSNCKFLYVSPERLETFLFKEYLPGMHINLIAVDEAHCISQWGYDFRPPYLRIAALREELPDVPVLALTASATPEVQNDICEKLTSPLTPLQQSWRGELSVRYPKYRVQDIVQYENAKKNRTSKTEAEAALWKLLRNSKTGYKFRRQHPIDKFIVDFICLEIGLIIEVDGEYHNNEEQKKFDEFRTEILQQKKFIVLRFTNEEVLTHPYIVENKIKEFIDLLTKKQIEGATSPFSISDGEGSGMRVFRQSFERPNLSYSVFEVDSKINKIIEVLTKVTGSAIVYCKSRKRTKEIGELLHLQNISADYYHAGLTQQERNRKQEEWIQNKTRVIVCTNAFGMGIDKPDVRSVIHADVPDCLENFYQEAGRAGRDWKRSYAVLLYDERDIRELEELTKLRYPSLEEIRKIYQAVANYLQIPSGSGEGQNYDFDIADFMKKFNLNSNTALFALKALEQEGWLAFNEQVFLPSSVMFTTTKNELNEFEKINPQLELLIKSLLRAYEGIFDHPANISEFVLAGLMKKDMEEVKMQLLQLQQFGIIEYHPQKDGPQICFLQTRIKAEDLTINMTEYNKRKEKFRTRTKEMMRFVKEKTECRSRMIASYFGDASVHSCGICDNCLRLKNISVSKEEFESINHRILNTVKYEPLHTKDLLLKLSGVKKEKAWKVLEFLQAENKIEMDKSGWVRMK